MCGCVYAPHPTKCKCTFCIKCGCIQNTFHMDDKKYNKKRRQFKAALLLSSVIAPISSQSKDTVIHDICESYGLESITSVVHVRWPKAFVRLDPALKRRKRRRLVENLRQALLLVMDQPDGSKSSSSSPPMLLGIGLQHIPTRRDADQSLLILQLQLTKNNNAAAAAAVQEAWKVLKRCVFCRNIHCTVSWASRPQAGPRSCVNKSRISASV